MIWEYDNMYLIFEYLKIIDNGLINIIFNIPQVYNKMHSKFKGCHVLILKTV